MPRKTLKTWLADANGWRRIWFVATLLTFLYFCLIFPVQQSDKGSEYRYRTKWEIQDEMKNPKCADYMSKTFSLLQEPEYDLSGKNGCYSIYLHRRYLENNKPITEKEYLDNFEKEHWERIREYTGAGFILAFVLSAFVYGVGFVTSWIIKGFKKSESQ